MNRLENARTLLKYVRAQTNALGVAYSHGKDSIAVTELASEMNFHLEAWMGVRVFGLRIVEEIKDFVLRRWGIVLRIYPWTMGVAELRKAFCQPNWKAVEKLPSFSMKETENVFKLQTKVEWTAHGWRANDSLSRALALASWGGIDVKNKKVFPLRRWRRDDVYSYLRQRNIPYPPFLGQLDQAGIDLHPGSLSFFKRHYPDDLEKILEVYPYAEARIKEK